MVFGDEVWEGVESSTFILAYILEGKGQAGILPLDDAHLAKGTLADDPEESKVIEID